MSILCASLAFESRPPVVCCKAFVNGLQKRNRKDWSPLFRKTSTLTFNISSAKIDVGFLSNLYRKYPA